MNTFIRSTGTWAARLGVFAPQVETDGIDGRGSRGRSKG